MFGGMTEKRPARPFRRRRHRETHRSGRGGWLRAAVLGSNDAICSTSSLMIGVAASNASARAIFTAGVAGLAAGAMSMAVGEYVSVSSQRDAERADIAKEKEELANDRDAELKELSVIYERRGLDKELARRVAEQLTEKDELGAHLRDELGIDIDALAKPLQAAWISALSFAAFALVPVLASVFAPDAHRLPLIAGVSLLALGSLGGLGAWLGGAPVKRAALRVLLGGVLAMAATALIGRLLGTAAAA